MNDYESKQEERRERYLERAAAAEREAERNFNGPAGRTLSGMMGEPIKVGHHSERRHRRLFEKADNEMRRACEALDKAKHYQAKAAGVGRGGISSDDPDAIDKLRDKLARLEKKQADMKAVNRIVRSKPRNELTDAKIAKLAALGISEENARKAFEPDFCGRIGIPDYALTNNNANIRRIRQRIESLERKPTETKAETVAGVRIVENAEANRLQVFFPGKPAVEVRAELKARGFRWARSAGAWQRHLSNGARYAAESIVTRFYQ